MKTIVETFVSALILSPYFYMKIWLIFQKLDLITYFALSQEPRSAQPAASIHVVPDSTWTIVEGCRPAPAWHVHRGATAALQASAAILRLQF